MPLKFFLMGLTIRNLPGGYLLSSLGINALKNFLLMGLTPGYFACRLPGLWHFLAKIAF